MPKYTANCVADIKLCAHFFYHRNNVYEVTRNKGAVLSLYLLFQVIWWLQYM